MSGEQAASPAHPPAHPLMLRRFAYARTLHAGFPAACLWIERFKWALSGFVDSTRPMDKMPLSLDTPAEDEIAISALAGAPAPTARVPGCREGAAGVVHMPDPSLPIPFLPPLAGVSAYLPLCFMRSRHLFDSYYTFEDASEEDFELWRSTMLWFFRKVGCRDHWGGA